MKNPHSTRNVKRLGVQWDFRFKHKIPRKKSERGGTGRDKSHPNTSVGKKTSKWVRPSPKEKKKKKGRRGCREQERVFTSIIGTPSTRRGPERKKRRTPAAERTKGKEAKYYEEKTIRNEGTRK